MKAESWLISILAGTPVSHQSQYIHTKTMAQHLRRRGFPQPPRVRVHPLPLRGRCRLHWLGPGIRIEFNNEIYKLEIAFVGGLLSLSGLAFLKNVVRYQSDDLCHLRWLPPPLQVSQYPVLMLYPGYNKVTLGRSNFTAYTTDLKSDSISQTWCIIRVYLDSQQATSVLVK